MAVALIQVLYMRMVTLALYACPVISKSLFFAAITAVLASTAQNNILIEILILDALRLAPIPAAISMLMGGTALHKPCDHSTSVLITI